MASAFAFYNLCDYFEFLDDLRNSGSVNMHGAAPHLTAEYSDLDIRTAREVLSRWQKTFSSEALGKRVSKAQTEFS